MPFRRILLHAMLWSLGIGALLGAAAVFAGGGSTYWRICGTTFTTAIAAGLLIPILRLIDRPVARPAGLLGMCLVIVEFFVGLLLIWNNSLFMSAFEDSLAMTLCFLPLCGLAAAIFLRIAAGDSRNRWTGRLGIAIAVSCFVLIMTAAWFYSRWPDREKLMSSAGVLACFGLLVVACLASGSPKPNMRSLVDMCRLVGAFAAIAGGAMSLYAIWLNITSDSGVWRIVTTLASVIAYANVSLLIPLAESQRWLRAVTVGAALCTGVCLNVATWNPFPHDVKELAGRSSNAAGIITACGTLALLVMARINRKIPGEGRTLAPITAIRMICPGCERKQMLRVGQSACPACHLRFEIKIEEPRCPKCDYLLFMLKSDRCPECGELLSTFACCGAG